MHEAKQNVKRQAEEEEESKDVHEIFFFAEAKTRPAQAAQEAPVQAPGSSAQAQEAPVQETQVQATQVQASHEAPGRKRGFGILRKATFGKRRVVDLENEPDVE